MKSFKLFRLPSAVLFSVLSLAPFADARHEKCLPEETYFALQVRDIADYKAKVAKHPVAADFEKAGYEAYFAPGIKLLKEQIQKDFSENTKKMDFAKLLSILKKDFNGEALFAVVKTPKPEKGHSPYDFVLFLDTDLSEAKLSEFFKEFGVTEKTTTKLSMREFRAEKAYFTDKTEAEPTTGEDSDGEAQRTKEYISTPYQGITLHEQVETYSDGKGSTFSAVTSGWAVVGKTFIATTAPNVLRDLVDAAQNGRKDSFANTVQWRRASDAAGKADFLCVSNLKLASGTLREYIVKTSKDDSNPYLPQPVKSYDALALDAIDGLWFSIALTETGSIVKSSLSYTAKRGLLSLLTFKNLEQPVPEYIPAGVPYFSTSAFDMAASWKNFETLFNEALPLIKPSFDEGLAKLKKDEGVDIRRDLLENLGSNATMILGHDTLQDASDKFVPSFMTPALYIFDIRDTNKLQSLINTALAKMNEGSDKAFFDERNFMGVKINTFKEKSAPFSYAIHNGKLLLSINKADTLEETIAEMVKQRNPIAKEAFVQQAQKFVPKEKILFEVMDVSQYMDNGISLLELLAKQYWLKSLEKEDARITDPARKPSANAFPWVSTSYAEERTNEIYGETHLFRKEEK